MTLLLNPLELSSGNSLIFSSLELALSILSGTKSDLKILFAKFIKSDLVYLTKSRKVPVIGFSPRS